MKYVFIFAIVTALLVGCAAFKATTKEIAENPQAFNKEAYTTANTVKDTVPEVPYIIAVLIGYGLSFSRRLYKNFKIEHKNGSKVA